MLEQYHVFCIQAPITQHPADLENSENTTSPLSEDTVEETITDLYGTISDTEEGSSEDWRGGAWIL